MKTTVATTALSCILLQSAFAQADASSTGTGSSVGITATNGASLVPIIRLPGIPGGPPINAPVAISNLVDTATEHAMVGQTTLRSIQPAPYGAHAEYGLHSVDWQSDISDPRPVQITTPQGQVLSCAPTFLALWNAANGETFTLAQVSTNGGIGNVLLPDTVIWTNVFDTLDADVRYRYDGRANSLEQDIILHESPKDLPNGWLPEDVRIQVWTAWFDSNPVSTNTASVTLRPAGATAASVTMDDSTVDFDSMKIVAGSAFDLQSPDTKVPVAKSWVPGDEPGLSWLVETIDYLSISNSLSQLPQVHVHFSLNETKQDRESLLAKAASRSNRQEPLKPMLIAQNARLPDRGVVLDFNVISAIPLPANAISWWQGGGNALDAITNNNGYLSNGVTYAAAKVGQGFSFNGTSSFLQIPDAANLNPTNAITLEAWVYPTMFLYTNQPIFSKDDPVNGGGRQYLLTISDQDHFRAHIGTSNGFVYFEGTNSVALNTWYHVAMTYDGTHLRLYVNGAFDSWIYEPGGIITTTNTLRLGGSYSGSWGNYKFGGLIDEATVYSRALGLSEIQSIYNAGGAGKRNAQQCVTPSTNAVGWWAGDGTSNDLAHINFGMLVSGVTYAPGIVAQGFSFNGTSSYVEMTNSPDLNPTNAITLEAWVYQTTNFSQNQPIFSKDDPINGGGRQYVLTISDQDHFRAHIGTPYGFYDFDSTNFVALNTWYHVVMTYDWSYLRLYVNGVVDSGISVPGGIIVTTNTLRLGGSYSGSWGNYKLGGIIDEATVYNRALSASEISALYSAGAAGKCKVSCPSGLTYLQALFLGTDPNAWDTDGDCISDSDAVFVYHINPHNPMIVGWGDDSKQEIDVPYDLTAVSSMQGGQWYSIVLRTNDQIVAWGDNTYGQTSASTNWTNIVAISAGAYHGLALRADGTVTNWGSWADGVYVPAGLTNGLTNIIAVAAGADHDVALKSDGTVIVWGYTNDLENTPIPWLNGVKAISASYVHSVALLTNGTVVAWGNNGGSVGWNTTNVPASATNVIAIATGSYHSLALRSDGTVIAWGAGNGSDTLFSEGQSIVPAGLSNVTAIAAGGEYSMALKSDLTVVTWGDPTVSLPIFPLTNIVGIASGATHELALRSGTLTPLIAQQPANQYALPGSNATFTAKAIALASLAYQWQFNGVNIQGATGSSLTLTNVQASTNGNYQVVVTNCAGSITSAAATFNLVTPPQIVSTSPQAGGTTWIATNTTLSVTATGVGQNNGFPLSYYWQRYGTNWGYPAPTINIYNLNLYNFPPIYDPTIEGNYSVIVSNAAGTISASWNILRILPGTVEGWGANDAGQLNRPATLTNAIAIAAGDVHTTAVVDGGSVVQWGTSWANIPANLTNAISVAAGATHTLALRADGTVTAWGTGMQTNVPPLTTNVIAVSASGNQSLALYSSGKVVQWGQTNGTIPGDLTNAVAIASGTNFHLALRATGNLAAWGNNSATNVPSAATNVVAIAACANHALAVKADGTVVAWGSNGSGESTVPASLSNVMAVAAGWTHSVALKNDRTVVAWGDNTYGQTTIITNLASVKSIAAGGRFTIGAVFSPVVAYPISIPKDLLLIYNTNSANSIVVKNYYLANRPFVSNANLLAIGCPPQETTSRPDFTNTIRAPLLTWLSNNPTIRPQYWVLFIDIPSRINAVTNAGIYPGTNTDNSVSVELYSTMPNNPFVTHINMLSTNDCIAYINKLVSVGTNYSPGKIVISPSSSGRYSNTNFLVDDVRHGGTGWPGDGDYSQYAYLVTNAITGINQSGLPGIQITFADGVELGSNGVPILPLPPHITNAVNVAGYIGWGAHSQLGNQYAIDTNLVWTGNSSWYPIATAESFNGWRSVSTGTFIQWFASIAFGGLNYSNTPVCAATHVDEPFTPGVTDSQIYFGLWCQSKNFAICAWASRRTPSFQAVGDPFVAR